MLFKNMLLNLYGREGFILHIFLGKTPVNSRLLARRNEWNPPCLSLVSTAQHWLVTEPGLTRRDDTMTAAGLILKYNSDFMGKTGEHCSAHYCTAALPLKLKHLLFPESFRSFSVLLPRYYSQSTVIDSNKEMKGETQCICRSLISWYLI